MTSRKNVAIRRDGVLAYAHPMNRAVLLVLANLALMGCGKKAGPGNVPFEQRKDCSSEKDCTDGENTWCMKSGDASTGKCYPQPREGRPLAVDGELHVAPLAGEGSGELARLRAAAQDEHASVAAFARTIAELMALGAPLSLLAETQLAMSDEIRHTERTLDVIEQLTGERPAFGALPEATAPLARGEAGFFRDVLIGGAIGETLAAAAAQARLDARPSDLDEMILADESRHAALAFKTLRWLSARNPSLIAIVTEERAKLAAVDSATDRLLAPLFETAFSA